MPRGKVGAKKSPKSVEDLIEEFNALSVDPFEQKTYYWTADGIELWVVSTSEEDARTILTATLERSKARSVIRAKIEELIAKDKKLSADDFNLDDEQDILRDEGVYALGGQDMDDDFFDSAIELLKEDAQIYPQFTISVIKTPVEAEDD